MDTKLDTNISRLLFAILIVMFAWHVGNYTGDIYANYKLNKAIHEIGVVFAENIEENSIILDDDWKRFIYVLTFLEKIGPELNELGPNTAAMIVYTLYDQLNMAPTLVGTKILISNYVINVPAANIAEWDWHRISTWLE